jgi:hypothetical protein
MDDYKKLSREWGSKARKEEGRARKARLKRATKKEPTEEEFDTRELHECGPDTCGAYAHAPCEGKHKMAPHERDQRLDQCALCGAVCFRD